MTHCTLKKICLPHYCVIIVEKHFEYTIFDRFSFEHQKRTSVYILELTSSSEHSKELKSFRFKPNTLMKEIFIKALRSLIVGGIQNISDGRECNIFTCFAFNKNYR